jgi:hypothetical protein
VPRRITPTNAPGYWVWNNKKAKKALIDGDYKDIDEKDITENTNRQRIPEAIIAKFLSKDKENPLEKPDIRKLHTNATIYIIVPTSTKTE